MLSVCFQSIFIKFRSAISEKLKMCQSIKRQEQQYRFSNRPKILNLVEGVEILLSVKFRQISFSSFRKVSNVSANLGLVSNLGFPMGLKSTILVEAIEILLLVELLQIPFSGFRVPELSETENSLPAATVCKQQQ